MKKVILIYSNENITVANKFKTALTGHSTVESFELSDKNDFKTSGNIILNDVTVPVILIISDNFLKSEACMNNAMQIVQNIGTQKRLIPVTTDGVYRNVGGELSYVHTSFDRVSQVIQYMNFWQERYLHIRSQKTNGVESENADKTKLVRTISSEIGELLRYLRTMEYYTFDQFEATKFNTLYRLLDLDFVAATPTEKQSEKPLASVTSQENIYISNNAGVKEAIKETLSDKKSVFESELVGAKAHISDSTNGKNKTSIVAEKLENGFHKEQTNLISEILPTQSIKEAIEEKKTEQMTSNSKPPLTLEALIESIKKESLPVDKIENKTPSDIEDNKILAVKPTVAVSIETQPVVTTIIHPLTEIGASSTVEAHQEPGLIESTILPEAENSVLHHEEKSELIHSEPVQLQPEAKPIDIHAPLVENSFITEGEIIKTEKKEDMPAELSNQLKKTNDLNGEVHSATLSTSLSENNQTVKTKKETSTAQTPSLDTELLRLKTQIESHAENNDLRYQYASLLVENRQFDTATEQLEIILQNDRKHIDSYILLAYIAEQNRDYSLSLNSLEKVMLLQPSYPGIFYKLGTLTQTHFPNHPKKALYYFKESLSNEPNNAAAYFAYAQLLANNAGDPEEVKACYERTIELNPAHAQAHLELAKFYVGGGDKKTASSFYQNAIAFDDKLKSKENDEAFYYEEPKKIVYRDNGFTVMITGATSGIGKAAATLFAQHGYRLILTGRRAERLASVKTELEETYTNKILTLEFDVRNLESVHKAIEGLETEWQNIDILLNNAGLASGLSPIHEGDVRDWEKMIDTNIKGLLYVTRAVTPGMVARRKGHVINICSTAGKEIYPSGNVYVATKHAVDALTRSMRLDLFRHNVRVSQVAPGMVEDTEFSLVRFHGDAEKAKIYEDIKPLNAADIADTIYYIATRPDHVNIQDVVLMSVQQGSANHFDRSGRNDR